MAYKVHTYNVELEVLTPVIINTGEYYQIGELQPTNEIIETKSRFVGVTMPSVYRWSEIDLSKAILNIPQERLRAFTDKAVSAIKSREQNQDALIELRSELNNLVCDDIRREVRVLNTAKKELFWKPMQQVSKIATLPLDGKTYIPGSSIKGAFRTGYLEWLRKESNYDYFGRYSEARKSNVAWKDKRGFRYELEMLKGKQYPMKTNPIITDDPFKYIKISDFVFFDDEDCIAYIAGVNDRKNIPIYTAMTNSFAYSGRTVMAQGTISVDDRFFELVKDKIDKFESVLDVVEDFYLSNLNLFKDDIADSPLMNSIYREKCVNEKSSGYHLIKLGHYIGAMDHQLKVDCRRYTDDKKGGPKVKLEGGIIPGICTMRIVGEKTE